MKRNENILTALLRALGIPHTRTYADRLLKDRPKRGTLYDLSLLLRRYGIGSKGVKWHDKDNLDGLPSVFVAQVGSDFLGAQAITGQRAYLAFPWSQQGTFANTLLNAADSPLTPATQGFEIRQCLRLSCVLQG